MTKGDFREVSLEMGEVSDLSLFLIECLEDNKVSLDMALASLALTLARLSNPFERLTQEQEIKLTTDLMSFMQMNGGTVN